MEGLVDYVKRQVKCPECRAEHRVPYNGIQGFPTNVTLQRFLELHADITGMFQQEKGVRQRVSSLFFVRRITGSKCRRYYVKMWRMF